MERRVAAMVTADVVGYSRPIGAVEARGRCRNGIALVAVLWVLVLLSITAAAFLNETRTETKLARNLVDNAKARALADAGVHRAIVALLPSPGAASRQTRPMLGPRVGREPARRDEEEPEAQNDWRADGTVHAWTFGGGEVRISIQDEAGKINLNRAPDELLKGLFLSVGVDDQQAAALADAIADFRDKDDLTRLNGAEDDDYRAAGLAWEAKDAPFATVAELEQVLGMTRELVDRVAPFVTVHTKQRGIDPAIAPREVLLAIPGVNEVEVDALLAARAGSGSAADWERVLRVEPVPSVDELPDPSLVAPDNPAEALASGWLGIRRYVSRSRGRVHTVRAEAVTATGAVFVREAVVGLSRDAQQLFRFHTWRQGDRSTPDAEEMN